MSITETPPVRSSSEPPRESAMLVGFNPMLLSELQDELARSRLREAFWISVAVHLFLVMGLTIAPAYLIRRPVVVRTAEDMMQGKDLTFLELPPDAQKPPERAPNTNIISDKNRVATSRNPMIDRKTLDELRDNRRPGPPGMTGPAMKPSPPAAAQPQQQVAQAPPTPQNPPGPQGGAPQPPAQTQAKLEQPASATGRGSFGGGSLSPGSAIEQAARATAGARGGSFGGGGAGGDYGLGRGVGQGKVGSDMDILSDTMGVDFGPYLQRVLHDVRQNWYAVIPEAALPPLLKKGKVSIEFVITKDGRVAGLRLVGGSGDVSLDRAAWGGITASDPFPPLPREFAGPYLALRFHFYYNPAPGDIR